MTLDVEVRRLQNLLNQTEEMLEEEKRQNVQLRLEKENLHTEVRTPEHQLITDLFIFYHDVLDHYTALKQGEDPCRSC